MRLCHLEDPGFMELWAHLPSNGHGTLFPTGSYLLSHNDSFFFCAVKMSGISISSISRGCCGDQRL